MGNRTVNRQRRDEWRRRIPELRRIVEDEAPAAWDAAATRRKNEIPTAWLELVADMRNSVHAEAEKATFTDSTEGKIGFFWSFKVGRVGDMLEYLWRTILRDIGFEGDGTTLASMLLVGSAFTRVEIELQDGGRVNGRDDSEEQRYRVYEAIRCLTPRFDDVHMQRFRALQVAESCASRTHIPSERDVEREYRTDQKGGSRL